MSGTYRPVGGIAATVLAIISIAVGAACTDNPTSTKPAPPQIRIAAGDGQIGVSGDTLPRPLAVRVTAPTGSIAMSGIVVEFVSDADATSKQIARTDAEGLASVSWITESGPGTGTQIVRARVAGEAGPAATFTIRAAGSLTRVFGDRQAATPGAELPRRPTVLLLDTDQRVITGAPVSWVVTSGLGFPTTATSLTDSLGEAAVRWVIGPQGGADVHALVASFGRLATTFTASGALDSLQIRGGGGDGTSGVPGRTVTARVRVVIDGINIRPLVNTPVEWIVTAGSGTTAWSTSATDHDGYATTKWTVGDEVGPGTQRLQARLVGAEAIFTQVVASISGPASNLVYFDGYSAVNVNTGRYGFGLVVADEFGTGMDGVRVQWAVQSAGQATGTVEYSEWITSDGGEAYTALSVGSLPGSLVLIATVTRPDGTILTAPYDVTVVP